VHYQRNDREYDIVLWNDMAEWEDVSAVALVFVIDMLLLESATRFEFSHQVGLLFDGC
jgi:hypothetical protein